MGTFDPNAFLDQTTQEQGSTQSVPIPVGEYTAMSKEPEIRSWTSKDGTKSGFALDIIWEIDDAAVKELLQRDTVTIKQGIMLDVQENGSLDWGKGKNVTLGRLREAVGLNTPGQPFNPRMLGGQVAKISVKHRVDGENIYSEVKGVAKLT